ncbi:MAG: hypothetical protein LBB60_00435 [Desulfovibrio sp.]|jgi:hypothetical protein|nr:hypothetical protein [Desulfovibrio sp.]
MFGLQIKKGGISAHLGWGELYLITVTSGMLLFGLWAWYDGHALGTPQAGWRFLLLFVVLVTPALSVLFFWKPRTS